MIPVRRLAHAALAIALLCMPLAGAAAQAISLEIGAAVPAGSPWDMGLRKIASEWSRISGGRVKLVFPKSMTNASQEDIVQKMKLSLEGGLLETSGLYLLDKDWLLFSMPSVIQTAEEFTAAVAAALPTLRSRIADRYEIITVAQGGWLRLFSNRALLEPEDLVSARIGVQAKQAELVTQLQSLGARTVKSDASSLLTHFSNGSIDISYSSPLYIKLLWSQFRAKITHMSSFRLSPFFGALVLNKRSWDGVPSELKPALVAAADKVASEIAAQALVLEDEAIAAMLKDGLKSPALSAAQALSWTELFTGPRMRTLLAGWFSSEVSSKVFAAVDAQRR